MKEQPNVNLNYISGKFGFQNIEDDINELCVERL